MNDAKFLAREHLQSLIDQLISAGYRVLGPVVMDHAIQFAPISDSAELPAGWQDNQSPGRYRLEQTRSSRCFDWAVGPQAIKPLTFAPRETLWTVTTEPSGALNFQAQVPEDPPTAVIGARACDLAALALHDQHFIEQQKDPAYASRRTGLFIVAVNCSHPAETCFCASTGDGPEARHGYDLVLSELDAGYLVAAGSSAGKAMLEKLRLQAATPTQLTRVAEDMQSAADRQTRALPTGNLQSRLFSRLDHPRWEQVASRCLSCGNCTSVCPTCFCNQHAEQPALGGAQSEHIREWDSCFTEGHSYLHGFLVRPETRHRFRQWMTHKLGSWHEQFGRSGCVGCGRCITWCPVAIDITEEANILCAMDEGEDA